MIGGLLIALLVFQLTYVLSLIRVEEDKLDGTITEVKIRV